ncbi:MAG: hypothetical protein KKC84_00540 [Candidatus Omnitrophica bacterium]|nr:hypothetical protein [Candidatus Omnitrophota bacterium]
MKKNVHRLPGKKAQVSLELCVAVACVLIIFSAIYKIFLWVNSQMLMRQEVYEMSRIEAGTHDSLHAVLIDETQLPRLGIFSDQPVYRTWSEAPIQRRQAIIPSWQRPPF